MMCSNCGKKPAVWKNRKVKVARELKYLCDPCLSSMPHSGDAIDSYDFVGKVGK